MEKQRLREFKQLPQMSQFQSSRWKAQGQVQPVNMNHEGNVEREAVRSSADSGLHDYVALWSCWWGRPLHHPFLRWSPHSFLPAFTWNSLGESCIRNDSPKKHRVCPRRYALGFRQWVILASIFHTVGRDSLGSHEINLRVVTIKIVDHHGLHQSIS